MRTLLILVGALAIYCGACCGAVWWSLPGRHIGTFDIGDGREVRIWSEHEWFEPYVPMYYEIVRNGEVISPRWGLDIERGQEFQFRTAFAEGGKIACVYEVNIVNDNSDLLVMYDAELDESWPRCAGDWVGDPAIKKKRQGRYRKLREANPGFPEIRFFEE